MVKGPVGDCGRSVCGGCRTVCLGRAALRQRGAVAGSGCRRLLSHCQRGNRCAPPSASIRENLDLVLRHIGRCPRRHRYGWTVAYPSWKAASKLDGTRPDVTGCADPRTASPVVRWDIRSPDGASLGKEELVYSTSCRTAWVRVNITAPHLQATKSVTRSGMFLLAASTTVGETDSTDEADGVSFSRQVWAPRCVTAHVELYDGKRRLDSTRGRTVCGLQGRPFLR